MASDDKVITFNVPPQTFDWSKDTEYVPLTELGGSKTYHRFIRSNPTQLTLNGIIFGMGCDYDVSPVRTVLDDFCSSSQTLTFTQIGRVVDNLLLQSYSWSESQIISGFPTRAECSLTLLIQGEIDKPKITETTLTEAEKDRAKKEAEKLGFKKVTVSDKGVVKSSDKEIGNFQTKSPFFKLKSGVELPEGATATATETANENLPNTSQGV